MKTIALIFGTRPEIIKLAPVVQALHASSLLEPMVVSTGQHSSLKDIALAEEKITVDVELNLMEPNQSLANFFSRCLERLDAFFGVHLPDGVIVQGDTASALAGALAAFYRGIPVFHVEAGLRTGDLTSPFPEEANRKLISQIADRHFSPTAEATSNLLREGICPDKIDQVGNTILDSLLNLTSAEKGVQPDFEPQGLASHKENLVWTFHRRENQSSVHDVADTLMEIARANPDLGIWIPVHPNPAVAGPIRAISGLQPNLHVLEPLNHSQFLTLLRKCDFVVTDSGGVQEEALSLGKKILVLRNTTERPEVVSSGLGRLHDPNSGQISAAVATLLRMKGLQGTEVNPYGDGTAAVKIACHIEKYFGQI